MALYEVEFQISGYAKDTNHDSLVQLSDLVVKNLHNLNVLFGNYSIDGIRANSVVFDKAKDLVLNRLVINCQSLIRQEV